MTALSPEEASAIARDVYAVLRFPDLRTALRGSGGLGIQGRFEVAEDSLLHATSGGRLLNQRSRFGYVGTGVGKRAGEALVALRGTDLGIDWLSNANIAIEGGPSGYPVHAGFHRVFKHEMRTKIERLVDGCAPRRVHVVGHSLGGALATLTADALRQRGLAVKLYTFGAPRSGLWGETQHLTGTLGEENIYRVYHEADPVSMVPIFPFQHVPTTSPGYPLRWSGTRLSKEPHKMQNYTRSVSGRGWPALGEVAPGANWRQQAEAWLDRAASDAGLVQMLSVRALGMILRSLDWIVEQIGRNVGVTLVAGATVLDRLAGMLHTGALLAAEIAGWVATLMRAALRFLGRTLEAGAQLSVAFIRWVLDMLFRTVATAVRQATQLFD